MKAEGVLDHNQVRILSSTGHFYHCCCFVLDHDLPSGIGHLWHFQGLSILTVHLSPFLPKFSQSHAGWWRKCFSIFEMVLSHLTNHSLCTIKLLPFLTCYWTSAKKPFLIYFLGKLWCAYHQNNNDNDNTNISSNNNDNIERPFCNYVT